jgi:pimeloyl-ACP methyl ester carboxylesterase
MRTPVMMLHGMNCTGEVWTGFRAFFEARGVTVYTPTLRPDIRSTLRERPNAALRHVGLEHYIDDLEREAQRIERDTGLRPAIIGHSMGGLLAQALAERGAVSAGVFVSPSPPAGIRTFSSRLFWSAVAVAYALRLGPWAIKPVRRTLDRSVFNALPAAERAAAHEAMVYESGRALRQLGHWPIDPSKINVPVLTIACGADRLIPPELVRLIGRRYARIGGEFREYPQDGHWFYAEPNWEAAAADIYDWLSVATAQAESTRAAS